jgi:hypothetical protein
MASKVPVTWRPLTQWPAGRPRTAEYSRENANFARGEWKSNVPGNDTSGATWTKTRTPLSRTLADLDRELWMIGAGDVVVQLDVRSESQFRRDGTGPLSTATTQSPAVVVTFMRKKVPYVFAGDFFKRWEDNLRAIVLGLDGLRRLERYHIAQSGDQYRGWQALPASTTTAFTTEQAAKAVGDRIGWRADIIVSDREHARNALRLAKSKAHPDAGGTTHDFQIVNECARVLSAHHGVSL